MLLFYLQPVQSRINRGLLLPISLSFHRSMLTLGKDALQLLVPRLARGCPI